MAITPAPSANSSNVSTLSNWAGPYVTDMLGKTAAYADTPYQVYQGPQTAGQSDLQSKVFQGLGGLNFPSNLGQSFSSSGAYQAPQMNMGAYQQQPIGLGPNAAFNQQANIAGSHGLSLNQGSNGFGDFGSQPVSQDAIGMPQYEEFSPAGGMNGQPDPMRLGGELGNLRFNNSDIQGGGLAGLLRGMPQQQQQPQNIAQQYMNPYLQSVLTPQLEELRRQNDITNMNSNAKLTGMGAFGGGRQAIMNAENNRNLMQEMNKTVGTGYANAYDKAQQQFNTEQGQSKTLADLMSQQGGTQRDIEQQGITADYNEFLSQRDYPQKMLAFQQSMLQGLPIATTTNQAAPMSGIAQLSSTIGGMANITDALNKFKLTTPP